MINEVGNIAVHTENIFPIIKKWLYSDKDIFIRELVSNGCDAINKFKKLVSIGEAEAESGTRYYIKVVVDKKNKTIEFIDNGIGMTAEEVKKYINQVAFSGAQDFLEKYKESMGEENQMIGHFGLGFYSAFMVARKVEIDTLSYQRDAEAVKWSCSGGTEYEMSPSDRKERGTTVTVHIDEDSEEFLDKFKVDEILRKYCSFLPVEIYLLDAEEEKKSKKEEDKPKPINDTNPLWLKKPSDCSDEEYKEFYKKVFHDFSDPLFWIHLNVDYPFNLKGILYFPKLKHEFESIEGRIKLYSNQVFVADNIKEIIPEFLLLLKGVLDCPDLPLNVSRSFLQNDGYVKKVSSHITKKVADKLTDLFKNERERYNQYWDDINPFIKYGCIREHKFYEKVKDIIIYKTISGEYVTLKQYLEKNKSHHKNKVFYITDEKQQAQYIRLFKEHGLEAVILPSTIDTHFIQFIEIQEKDIKFNRIDSDLSESLKGEEDKKDDKKMAEKLETIFRKVLTDDKLKIRVESLKSSSIPGMILLSEQPRRMQEMSALFGGMDIKNMFPEEQTLVLNKSSDLMKLILDMEEDQEKMRIICEQVYDLALISNKQLEPEAMTKFIERSNRILTMLAGQK
ncbi:MAG: molecular chaperone HtpG [Clostridiaceae bacterium]|nr:molecular chaperone HtpG [Clostridiaceae bacterium]